MAQHIGVRKIDESGKTLDESGLNFAPINSKLFSLSNFEKKYPFMATIDPYGDTYLNRVQIPIVVNELKEFLANEDINEDERQVLEKFIHFIGEANDPSIFVLFIGD